MQYLYARAGIPIFFFSPFFKTFKLLSHVSYLKDLGYNRFFGITDESPAHEIIVTSSNKSFLIGRRANKVS